MTSGRIPHLRVVVGVTIFVLLGFAAVSVHVLLNSDDEVTKGNIIGTWQNFALLAVGFWIGSSSGGKSQGQGETSHSAAEGAKETADAAKDKAEQIGDAADNPPKYKTFDQE